MGMCSTCPTPSSVTALASPNSICEGNTLTLTGNATSAIGSTNWSWTGPNNFTSTLQSPTISSITSAEAGVYTLTASNSCGTASAVNTISVIVNTNSIAASVATTSMNPTCMSGTTNLTATGGSLGTGASWKWYTFNCGGTLAGTGSPLAVTPATTTNYYVRAEGTCNNTFCTSITVTVNTAPSIADAGSDINPACGVSIATLAWNTPTVGTGTWSVISGTATITTPSSPTSGVTGLAVPGITTLRWTTSNAPCFSTDDVIITTTICITCPANLAVTHTIGTVAPESKF